MSTICKRRTCVTKVGSSSNVDEQIDSIVYSLENEFFSGEYTVNDIGRLENTSPDNFIQRIETPIQSAIRQYGEEDFYTSVASINSYFERVEISNQINRDSYPYVSERLQGAPLSPIEVANFIFQYQYTPRSLTFQSQILSTKILIELENFYTGNLSKSVIGSFCALMPNVFGAIDTFFTALSDIQNFIGNIKKFALNLQISFKALLDNLKKKILQTVDKLVENIKNIAKNFTIENVIQEVKTFVQNNAIKRFNSLKQDVTNFFNDFNIENIKKRIEAVIDTASRIFKNPTLEDIQYLIYRFCNVASQIENSFNALLNPLKEFSANLSDTIDILKGRSNSNTSNAILAGAIRLSPEEISRRYELAPKIKLGDREVIAGEVGLSTLAEISNVTQWNNGQGDARVTFSDGMRVDPYRVGEVIIGPASIRWTEVDDEAKVRLMRVQARFGKQLIILSGFRDPRQQAILYQNDLKRNGGNPSGKVAKPGGSAHEKKIALDVTWAGFNRETGREFLKIAVEEGFYGIGGYPSSSFVHIDLGPTRRWGDTFGIVSR